MSFRTNSARVEGLGTAREGTGTWLSQRLSSLALVPLTLLFIVPFVHSLGQDFEAVRATYARPFNAIVAILFILVNFHHLQQGLQVVVEDYVHGKAARSVLLLANMGFCWALGLVGVFAVAKIAFAA